MQQADGEFQQDLPVPAEPAVKWYQHINFVLTILIVLTLIGIAVQARYR